MITPTNSRSFLTHNILVTMEDGTVSTNTYGELYQFIGSVDFIETESKQASRIKFESQQFVLEKCNNIHASWLEFQKLIELKAEELKHTFVNAVEERSPWSASKKLTITLTTLL